MAFGAVVRSAAAPNVSPMGCGGDVSIIYLAESADQAIYELKMSDLSVSRSGGAPYAGVRDMGGDSSSIWHCTTNNRIYELETSDFSSSRYATSPSTECLGVGGDSSTIWHCDEDAEKVYELKTSDLSVSRSAASPSTTPFGIGGDSSVIYHSDDAANKVYQLKTSDFSVSRSAASAASYSRGIGGDTSKIWMSIDQFDKVYELDTFIAPDPPTSVQATDGVHNDKVVVTWGKSTNATGYQVYRDGTPLGWLGDVATYNDTGAGAPSITAGAAVASDGTSPDHVSLSLAGESTSVGATHTYKVKARNAAGESGDSGTNTGYRGVGALTYQWQRSAADSDADYTNIDGATTESYNDTGAPADGSGRHYQCVENADGATQQISSSDRGYRAAVEKKHTFRLDPKPRKRMSFHPNLKLG